jgi:Ala-tRNA(Pro) deacylase
MGFMPATRDALFLRLAELKIETSTIDHPAVFTVAESTALQRDLLGGHTKNLFLKDAKGRLFLVVAEATTAVDLKTLHTRLGCQRLSFGKPDLLLERLGITPGSVTAFAIMNDVAGLVTLVVDEALMRYDTINCHPLTNTATTSIRVADLFKFFDGCHHTAKITRLTADQP